MEKLTEQPIKKKIRNFITLNSVTKDEIRKEYNEIFDKLKEYEDKQEWISVEDRLPQENQQVLAINSDGEIFIATYLVHKISPSARGYMTWASGKWNGKPTHWQPLPKPPKMKGAE